MLETIPVYWLTFSRFVTGKIPMDPAQVKWILERPVPPGGYSTLARMFNANLATRNLNPGFVDSFVIGPEKRQLKPERRQQLRHMYLELVNDQRIEFQSQRPPLQRLVQSYFHVPLLFDAVYSIESRPAFVKYLFAYSSPEFVATPDEIDVFLALSTVLYPKYLNELAAARRVTSLFPDFHDPVDFEYWAIRFQVFSEKFYRVNDKKVEAIFTAAERVASELDLLLETLEESKEELRRRFAEKKAGLGGGKK